MTPTRSQEEALPRTPKRSAVDNITSPTVRARWLSIELKRLRTAAGMTQKQAASEVGWSHGTVGHLETREVPTQRKHLLALLPVYKVSPDRVAWYLAQADKAGEKGWWDQDPGVPGWFSMYVGLEQGASVINLWDIGFVPGLFQTRGYAESVTRDPHQVAQRMRRQEALTRPERPLQVHAIISQAALQQSEQPSTVMHEQLLHLVSLIRTSKLRIQVLPFTAGKHRGQLGSFTWLGFPHDEDAGADEATVALRERLDPGVAYVENQIGGVCHDNKDQIHTFRTIFGELVDLALTPDRSATLIEELARGFAA